MLDSDALSLIEHASLRARFEALGQYFIDEEPPFPVRKDSLLAAIGDLQAASPLLSEITPATLARVAGQLRDRYSEGSPRGETAERKFWQYVAKIIWVPRRISPQDIAGLLEHGFGSRQVSALAQWVAAQCLLVRRDAGVAAIATCQTGLDGSASPSLIDFAGLPSDLTREEFVARHAAAIGTWYPWIDYEEDGFDWRAHFDEERQSRTTFRVTASDRRLTKILTGIEDEIFGSAAAGISDGLARTAREMCALVTSVANGCGYCTAANAKVFVDSGGSPRHAIDIVSGRSAAYFGGATQILIDAVRILNDAPSRFSTESVADLRAAGFSDRAILDLVHATAYFNYANRVLIALGGYRGGE